MRIKRRVFAAIPGLFVQTEKGFRPVWNWNEELKKRIKFDDFKLDIEKMARKLGRKLGFDWQDLAFGEGFMMFEQIVERWNPERANFKSWIYSVLKRRMLDRLQKKDWRQPGVRRGRGKYFEAPVYSGIGNEIENSFDFSAQEESFEERILEKYDRSPDLLSATRRK